MISKQIWRAARNLKSLRLLNVYGKDTRSIMRKQEVYYVAFADKPLYLQETSQEDNIGDEISESLRREIPVCFSKSAGSMLVAEERNDVTSDSVRDYVRSCQAMVTLMQKVDNKREVVLGASGFSKNGDRLKRNLFFTVEDESKNVIMDCLGNVEVPKDIKMFKMIQQGGSNVFKRTELNNGETNEIKTFVAIVNPKTDPCPVPPIFQSPDFSPVFHSFERTLAILQMVSETEQVAELLEIGQKELPKGFEVETLQSQMKFPFVVVEGMDASGKTTLTETLERKLQAVRYCTPPPCVVHLRKFFDGQPEIVRRAYYTLGNYIVAVKIAKECKNKSVIMDRFWHSTAAYGIANETTLSDLPTSDHMTYEWPGDLLKPTCVLFLTVSEEVRKQRMNQREGTMTREELSLDRDALFRERLCRAYQRMRNPKCVEINASGTRGHVVEMAETALTEHGINL